MECINYSLRLLIKFNAIDKKIPKYNIYVEACNQPITSPFGNKSALKSPLYF